MTRSTQRPARLRFARAAGRLFLAAVVAAFPAMAAGPAGAATRPNIIVVMADDLGFSDLGCYGGEIETPNLDALAGSGLRFTQFYNTAKCHSSRVSLLTGLYCFQAGSESLARGVTIAEVLSRAGYFTAMSGKWHLDGEPTDRGFDRYFGHLSGATNYFRGDDSFRLNGKPFDAFGDGFYTTDAVTDHALRFIDETLDADAARPFFLYLAYNAPHYPLQAPEEDVRKYRGRYREGWDEIRRRRFERQVAMGLVRGDWELSPRPDHVRAWETLDDEARDWEDFRMAVFAAMVDRLDRSIGRLAGHLKARGAWHDTIILFCSDNGACPFERTKRRDRMPWDPESYWTYDAGWAHVGNTPFRWYKQNVHEGGVASPLIVHWPAGLATEAGTLTDQPGHLIDLMATAVDLAGTEYPQPSFDGRPVEPLQGRSLVPIFRGTVRDPHPWLYFQFANNRAIRQGDWKLVSVRGGPWELYDLASDRTELDDLAADQPERARAMRELWHHVAETVDHAPKNLRGPVGGKIAPWKGR